MKIIRFGRSPIVFAALLAVTLFTVSPAQAQPCQVPDNGTGTVDLPPQGCGYVSPDDLHLMIGSLPAGTQINVAVTHEKFFQVHTQAGGSLGGEIETFESLLFMDMTGTGDLLGFNRFVVMQIATEVHTGPRNNGDSVQSFQTEMVQAQGQIIGDPDFDLLTVRAGSGFGMPSPGHTTLTRLPGGGYNVDSFFDITYEIEFQGAPGSILFSHGGTTTATIRMQGGEPAPDNNACVVPDNGTGTINLPPANCGYVSPDDLHMIIDGLPAGTEINVDATHERFFQPQVTPGGSLGGEIEIFQSQLTLHMQGTGQLSGFVRDLVIPVASEVHTAPRTPGDPVQDFDNEMVRLQGAIIGDPDFDLLKVRAGSGFGMPSPGHTTLTRLPSGNYNVDSFFDITYTLEFAGAPGSLLAGSGGTTTGTIRMQGGDDVGNCPPLQPGADVFPSTAKLVLELFDDVTGQPFVLRLSSVGQPDSIVTRLASPPGDATTVPIELVQLSLTGNHPRVGAVNVRAGTSNGLPPSLGELTNIQRDPLTCELVAADSFFDIVVDIDVPSTGETWSCDRPLRLEARLTGLPPKNVRYENPFLDPVVLRDNQTGQVRGRILYEVHHVDPPFPDPGPDCFNTFLRARLTAPPIGLFGQPISAQGPTTVRRGPAQPQVDTCQGGPLVGQPCSTDQDCLGAPCAPSPGQIQTEIVSMDLTGFDPQLGGINIRQSPKVPSRGSAQSQNPGRTYPVDSFFDVFITIDAQNPGATLHNQQPVPIQALLSNIPPDPGTAFNSPPGQTIPLLLDDGTPIGVIFDVSHVIDPPQDWDAPPPPDDYCFDSWVHLELTIDQPFCTEELWLRGDFRVLRDALATDPTGQSFFATLMAKAIFDGDSQCVGPVSVRLNPAAASGGQVQPLTPEERFPADSFFDVFMTMDTGIGPLATVDPARMTTTINALPPDDGEIYFGPGTVIPLYDNTGQQIGHILEVSHEVHETIECPPECLPRAGFPNPGDKNTIVVGIPDSGGGIQYDILRGTLNVLRGPSNNGTCTLTGGSCTSDAQCGGGSDRCRGDFSDGVCIDNDGTGTFFSADQPDPGDGFYFIGRDVFGAFQGTYNSSGGQQRGDRDPRASAPNAPGACPLP